MISPLVALARPHQWIKNLFVAAPLFFTPRDMSLAAAAHVLLALACFCAAASAIYVLNDWTDRAADRRHPTKRHRPLAAGSVTPAAAAALAAGLVLAAVVPALLFLPHSFLLVLLGYALLNLAYSFGLKRIAIVDVMVIAIGFVLRIYAGGA